MGEDSVLPETLEESVLFTNEQLLRLRKRIVELK
jgi:hypothetical protein